MPFRPIGPRMDQDSVVRVVNDNFVEVDNRLSPFIVKDENGDRRIFIGKDPNGNYVLAVSKEGEDVVEVLSA